MPFEFEEGGPGEPKTGKGENPITSGAKPQPVIAAVVTVVEEIKKKAKKKNKASNGNQTEVKTTTGDCAVSESWNGRTVLNTVDNTFKVFAAGAWQTVHSGW